MTHVWVAWYENLVCQIFVPVRRGFTAKGLWKEYSPALLLRCTWCFFSSLNRDGLMLLPRAPALFVPSFLPKKKVCPARYERTEADLSQIGLTNSATFVLSCSESHRGWILCLVYLPYANLNWFMFSKMLLHVANLSHLVNLSSVIQGLYSVSGLLCQVIQLNFFYSVFNPW